MSGFGDDDDAKELQDVKNALESMYNPKKHS